MQIIERDIVVNNQRLHAYIKPGSGKGVPLLMLNGLGVDITFLDAFVSELDDLEVVAFDIPGTGGSPTPVLPYRLSTLARTIVGLLDVLGYDIVDVMGVSWGGALAQQFARQYSKRCRRLILAATTTGAISMPGKPWVLARLANPFRYRSKQALLNGAATIYGGDFRNRDGAAQQHGLVFGQAPSLLGHYWQLVAIAGWTSVHWLRKLIQPTLILTGEDDPLVPMVNARLMAALIPNSVIQTFDCGHLFILTRKSIVARSVQEFLNA